MSRELTSLQLIERNIMTKYRKTIWHPFIDAVAKYRLIDPGDRICCCISGGKDSFLTAVLMRLLSRYGKVPFELTYMVMDPGYTSDNLEKIKANAAKLELPIEIFTSPIFEVANRQTKSPCYLCAKMRRGYLYEHAQMLGCNKIALGHHFDDAIETLLLSVFYSSSVRAMLPRLQSENFEGMELIRPLYRVKEESVIAWARYNDLSFMSCGCRFTSEKPPEGLGGTKRKRVKELIAELKKETPDIDKSLFNSLHSVALDTMPGFTYRGKEYSFFDEIKND